MTRHLAFCRYLDLHAIAFAVVAIGLLVCIPQAGATCTPRYRKAVVVQEVVPTVVVTPVAAFYAVPVQTIIGSVYAGSAGGQYVPPQAGTAAGYGPTAGASAPAPAVPAATGDMAELLRLARTTAADVSALKGRVDALEGKPATKPAEPLPPPMPSADGKPAVPSGALVLARSCSGCHTQSRLNKDTTFEMFSKDGKALTLTDRQWARALARVSTGKMPPPKKDPSGKEVPAMSDEDAATVADYIDKLLAAKK
jgi:mono/diheme cytochrome c family protein